MATSPGVLTHQDILALCGLPSRGEEGDEREEGAIRPARRGNVRSASYDLRLGHDFHFSKTSNFTEPSSGGLPVSRLEDGVNESIVIPPNDVAVVSSLEKLFLEDDLVAHLSLKQDVLLQGLIMASQSQIDAGYEGWIYALLYNLTDGDVTLRLGESVLRLELVKLSEASKRPYKGHFRNARLAKALVSPIESSMLNLRHDVELQSGEVVKARTKMEGEIGEERKRISRTQLYGGLIAAALTALAIFIPSLLGLTSGVDDARNRVKLLEKEVGTSGKAARLQRRTHVLETKLTALECKLGGKAPSGPAGKC